MTHYSVHLDRETPAGAGAAGTFQVISIEDAEDNDVTDLVDVGKHFASLDALRQAIAAATGENPASIDLNEV